MIKIVAAYDYHTFTVGSCGDVNLPTKFTLSIGTLDGGSSFTNYQHYIYAYLKYPLSDDFYDNWNGIAPEYTTYQQTYFGSAFGQGYAANFTLEQNIPISTSLQNPAIVCISGIATDSLTSTALGLKIYYSTSSGETGNITVTHCANITKRIIDAIGSDPASITITKIQPYTYAYTTDDYHCYWYWIIPALKPGEFSS